MSRPDEKRNAGTLVKIKDKTLCRNCFEEITDEPCPFCGYIKTKDKKDITVLKKGTRLDDRYVVGGVIGKGGFGITYIAYDLKLDRRIAIKEYFPHSMAYREPDRRTVSVSNDESNKPFSDGSDSFIKEASLVAQFNDDPGIISVYDYFRENNTVYYTMGFLQGETLKEYLTQKGKLSEGQIMKVFRSMTKALITFHDKGVLHRDISPDNIMLCSDGTVKLMDFGAARHVIAEQSKSLSVILKQGFAPLEQYQKRGKQGPWTDIYALGATIFKCLTGECPDDPMSRLEEDLFFRDNTWGISDDLWTIIKKSTMIRPEDRYRNASELKKDLDKLTIEDEDFDLSGAETEPVITDGQTDKTEQLSEKEDAKYQDETQVLSEEDEAEQDTTVRIEPQNRQSEPDDSIDDDDKATPDNNSSFTIKEKIIVISLVIFLGLLIIYFLIASIQRSRSETGYSDALSVDSYSVDYGTGKNGGGINPQGKGTSVPNVVITAGASSEKGSDNDSESNVTGGFLFGDYNSGETDDSSVSEEEIEALNKMKYVLLSMSYNTFENGSYQAGVSDYWKSVDLLANYSLEYDVGIGRHENKGNFGYIDMSEEETLQSIAAFDCTFDGKPDPLPVETYIRYSYRSDTHEYGFGVGDFGETVPILFGFIKEDDGSFEIYSGMINENEWELDPLEYYRIQVVPNRYTDDPVYEYSVKTSEKIDRKEYENIENDLMSFTYDEVKYSV